MRKSGKMTDAQRMELFDLVSCMDVHNQTAITNEFLNELNKLKEIAAKYQETPKSEIEEDIEE